MNIRTQQLFAWSGPLLIVVFLLGFWVIAGFVPPPSPHEGVSEIARFYQHDTDRIRIGLYMTMLSAALVGPWAVAITVQLKRIEGRYAPLAYLQLALGALLILEFIFPIMIWQAAAFRPFESPEVTHRLNDLGWLMFVGVVSTGVLEAIVIGVAVLKDAGADPVFPRWVGYFNLWVAVPFMPGGLVVFFKSGPFAWNGLLSWWLLLTAFAAWVLVMSAVVLRSAIPQQLREETTQPARSKL